MADEPTGDGSGAEVRLDLDTSPFEAALNKAAEKAAGWSTRITAVLEKVNSFSAEKVQELKEKAAGFAELSSEDIGAGLGTGIGAAIGTYLGGPAGTAIGGKLGAKLGAMFGSAVDLTPLAKAVEEAFGVFQDVTSGVSEAWASISQDAADTLAEIKSLISSITFADFFSAVFQQNDEAAGKIGGAWEKVSGRAADFADVALFRVTNAVDSVWAKIQEPLARVADVFQGVLRQLGVLDEGTQNWGDALRSVGNAGEEVGRRLAYALGYMETAFKKIGGYAEEYIVLPLKFALSKLFGTLADFISGLNQSIVDSFGGPRFEELDKAAAALKKQQENIEATFAEGMARARRNQELDLNKGGKDRAAAFDAANERGGLLAGLIDAERAVQAILDEILSRVVEAPKVEESPAMQATQAMLAQSQQANNAIARANAQAAGPNAPLERAAKAAEENLNKQQAIIDRLDTLNDQLKSSPVVRVESG